MSLSKLYFPGKVEVNILVAFDVATALAMLARWSASPAQSLGLSKLLGLRSLAAL